MELPSSKAKPVTIGICTSALRSNIEAFIAKVSALINVTVRFIELPYNDLDSFRLLSDGLDGVIICHSINNRGFAITDVMDALYDKFLPRVRRNFGKDRVCVFAHDFPWPMAPGGPSRNDHAAIKDTYMGSFRSNQPTTFECCKLAMICGRLDKQVDMDEEDWKQLEVFLYQCRVHSESFNNPSDACNTCSSNPGGSRSYTFLIIVGVIAFVAYKTFQHFRKSNKK
ncbi:uncharacterized protein LOC100892117 [Strongylocentrotus purpuratus]|uniref:Uncharacterized protein n=1 Tax=Strongylocentrotus purpuratus TaxID=7668 RepID=A0A7M7HLT3_STRPU|nr:uncharacterized protein LOC100892117 [Strongylocentrotus purpuratus]|eukprot:XP_011676342.1 PREDICTED: uncharacterized protein LOC100892117 [Strongylocentrotus purpuratus]